MSGRTLRNKKLRLALLQSTGGKCAMCGTELGPDWHADHIVPWSESRDTNVHEMQPLCPTCNLRKGARMPITLRAHQQAVKNALADISDNRLPFQMLVDVVPGGGKSMIPALVAQRFPNHKIAWYVPRLALQHQGAHDAMRDFGLELRDTDGNEINPSRGTRGFVSTHQALVNSPQHHIDELRRHRYIVIVDEVHHAKIDRNGVPNSLARNLDLLPYDGRVLMTGTLQTSDRSFIYGIPYKETVGGFIPDLEAFDGPVITYTRKAALDESAIVPLQIYSADGHIEYDDHDGGGYKGRLSAIAKQHAGKGIYTALRTKFADELFQEGVDHWQAHGKGKLLVVVPPRSGGAVKGEYEKYVRRLKEMNTSVGLAVQDNEKAHRDIRAFQDGKLDALVTVAMAYEGLNVPEITHLVCLTNVRSAPWIEQMLARAWRRCDAIGKTEAFAFVPKDPLMDAVVSEIKHDIESVIPYGQLGPDGPDRPVEGRMVEALQGFVESLAQDLLDGRIVQSEVERELMSLLSKVGVDASAPGVSVLMQNFRKVIDNAKNDRQEVLTPKEREDRLRRQLVEMLAAANHRRIKAESIQNPTDRDWSFHQRRLIRYTKKRIPDMTYEELQSAYRYAQHLCA